MATTCKLIAKNTLGSAASSVTLGSGGTIPQTYTDLLLVMSLRSDRSGANTDACRMEINGDSGNNYTFRVLYGDGSSAASTSGTAASAPIGYYVNSDSTTADTFSNVEVYIPNYAGSTNKSFSHTVCGENNSSTAFTSVCAHLWSSTAAITSLRMYPQVGSNWKANSSFYLYGITKA